MKCFNNRREPNPGFRDLPVRASGFRALGFGGFRVFGGLRFRACGFSALGLGFEGFGVVIRA